MTDPLATLVIEHQRQQVLIAVRGEIDLSNTAELQNAIEQVATAAPRLILDLTSVAYMDSSAIRLLLDVRYARPAGSLTVIAPDGGPAAEILRHATVPGLDIRTSPDELNL